jgi:hypothetical protein
LREAFEVVVPRAVHREIEGLAGKRAGYRTARKLPGADPCHEDLRAYRLSGPLAPIVCGVRLKRGYRLAFTTQPGHRVAGDVWDLLHDLFGVDNPPSGHQKPPCCEDRLPAISAKDLDTFLASLRRVQRGR